MAKLVFMKKPCFAKLVGAQKNQEQLLAHLRLLATFPQAKCVYSNAETLRHLKRLTRIFKRRAEKGGRLSAFVADKLLQEYAPACSLAQKLENCGRLERIAFEVCRHTRLAVDIPQTVKTCAKIFSLDLMQADMLAECLQMKKIQQLCLAGDLLLAGRSLGVILLCDAFPQAVQFGAAKKVFGQAYALQGRGVVRLKTYSTGNFALSIGEDKVTLPQEKFVSSDGIRFCLSENGRRLGAAFEFACFYDKASFHRTKCGALTMSQTDFLKQNAIVCNFEIYNGGDKARNVDLHFFADLCMGEIKNKNFFGFVQSGVQLTSAEGKWFCAFGADDYSTRQDGVLCFVDGVRSLCVAAKSRVTANFVFGAFSSERDAVRFVKDSGNFDFSNKDFVFCGQTEVHELGAVATMPPILMQDKAACEKKSFVRKNHLSPISGYNVNSFVSSDGEMFSVTDKLVTTPKFGGEKIFARIGGRTILLNSGEPHVSDGVVTFEKAFDGVTLMLEISHFAEKQYKITCKNKGAAKNLSAVLCFDFFKPTKVVREGLGVRFGGIELICPQMAAVATSAVRFDKFDPSFDFSDDLSSTDLCAMSAVANVEDIATIVFSARAEAEIDALDGLSVSAPFWNARLNELSATLLCADLKEIGMFDLPSVVYENGGAALKILKKVMSNGFRQKVVTAAATEKVVPVSLWAFALGASWFVSLYSRQTDCSFLHEKLKEIMLCKPILPMEHVAKAICLKKLFAFAKDKAACLTKLRQLTDEIKTFGKEERFLASLAGVGEDLPQTSAKEIFAAAKKTLSGIVCDGFLQVCLLENVFGVTVQDEKVKLCSRFSGVLDEKIDVSIADKKLLFRFLKDGTHRYVLNKTEIPSVFMTDGLQKVNFIDVYY